MNSSIFWDSYSSEYDKGVQKITGPCVVNLLEQVALLPVSSSARPIKVIDIAAGPGFLSTVIGEAYSRAGCLDKVNILSTDFSEGMTGQAQQHFTSLHWPSSQFTARTLDATNLVDVPSNYYTHAFCTFGIMMVPDAPKAIDEMVRVLEPAGTIGIATWQTIGWIPIISECLARAKLSSDKKESIAVGPTTPPPKWSDASYVRRVLEDAHFQNVHVSVFESRWSFANHDDCAKKLTHGPMAGLMLNDSDLTEEKQEKYYQVMLQVLPDMVGKDRDQPVDLPMIAIIAHGQKPAE